MTNVRKIVAALRLAWSEHKPVVLIPVAVVGGIVGYGVGFHSKEQALTDLQAALAADANRRVEALMLDVSDAVFADFGVRGSFEPSCVSVVLPRFARHVAGTVSCGMIFKRASNS